MDLEKMLERDPMSDRGISVVIPVCNQEEALAGAIAGIGAVLDRTSRGHELILVNDGSSDGTASVAQGLAANNRRVRLVSHASRQGYGAALRTGFRLAKYPLVLQVDVAHQYDLADMERMLQTIDPVDIVCGYRQRSHAVAGRWRYWIYRMMLRMVFGVGVRDVDCAFRLYRRSALRRIPIQSNGRFANAEILAKATFMNMLIAEVPVAFEPCRAGIADSREPGDSVLQDAALVFRNPQFRTSNSTRDSSEPIMQRSG